MLGSTLVPTPFTEVSTVAAVDDTPWTLPTRPARCTARQLADTDIAGCLVAASADPDRNGWPTPPFPSDPAVPGGVGVVPLAGWTFSGWGYNGSPALAEWEAQMVGNPRAIGPVRANQLRGLPAAQPLFEGFIRDIVAGGYRITDVGAYTFRCTSGSGKSCQGLQRDSLSTHSWGLGLDMNSGANPERTYVGIGGASACATPMVTDIPMWVVRAAERWGLYWGGYGWSGSCDNPQQQRTSATRDATHFEFRGSPALAEAIAAKNLGGSCLDVADDAGRIGKRCLLPGEVPEAGWRVVVNTAAPAGTTAALVNIAVTGATADGYVTAEACTARAAGPRSSSNGNAAVGRTSANLAVVPIDAAGRFCLYRSQPVHTVVDVQGFYAPARSAGVSATLFHAVAPSRLLDTRTETGCAPGECRGGAPVPAGIESTVAASTVPGNAAAVLANVTVTEPTANGYVTADSCANLTPGPQTRSNINFGAGDTTANLSVVPVEAAGGGSVFCTFATTELHQVIDVQGYYLPSSAATATPGWALEPASGRMLDTRECRPTTPGAAPGAAPACGQRNVGGSMLRLQAPAGASAVLVNLTLLDAEVPGFATAQPCSALSGQPGQSNGNVAVGRIAANLAVVAVGPDGSFCITTSSTMHVVVDLQGTLTPNASLRFVPITPIRRSDTRV